MHGKEPAEELMHTPTASKLQIQLDVVLCILFEIVYTIIQRVQLPTGLQRFPSHVSVPLSKRL